jgi:hypothetical protein
MWRKKTLLYSTLYRQKGDLTSDIHHNKVRTHVILFQRSLKYIRTRVVICENTS